jgi:hypothetical protein
MRRACSAKSCNGVRWHDPVPSLGRIPRASLRQFVMTRRHWTKERTIAGAWSAEQSHLIAKSCELQIASIRNDGTLRKWVPIWVVCVDGDVFVRTWYRRGTGWFGHVVDLGHARVRVPDLEVAVSVEDVGESPPGLRLEVDAAYRNKYGLLGQSSMVADDAAATTLRLSPE